MVERYAVVFVGLVCLDCGFRDSRLGPVIADGKVQMSDWDEFVITVLGYDLPHKTQPMFVRWWSPINVDRLQDVNSLIWTEFTVQSPFVSNVG